jgi:hypothetical protein
VQHCCKTLVAPGCAFTYHALIVTLLFMLDALITATAGAGCQQAGAC